MIREPGKRIRSTGALLVVSVALNLFLAAFIGGQAWSVRHPAGWFASADAGEQAAGGLVQAFVRQLAEKLPPDDGRLLTSVFAAKMPELLASQRQASQASERLRAEVVQQPYNDAKVRADIAAVREARQSTRAILEQTLLEVLPRMSDQGRAIYGRYRLIPRCARDSSDAPR